MAWVGIEHNVNLAVSLTRHSLGERYVRNNEELVC
jgi:hypothetical protein